MHNRCPDENITVPYAQLLTTDACAFANRNCTSLESSVKSFRRNALHRTHTGCEQHRKTISARNRTYAVLTHIQSMLRWKYHRPIRTVLEVVCEHLAKKHGISRCETVLLVTEATIARDVTPVAVTSILTIEAEKRNCVPFIILPLDTRTTTPPPIVYTGVNTYGVWYAKLLFSRDIPR